MKIGVCSANAGPYTTRASLRSLAEIAEVTGIESIWVSEHVVVTDPRTTVADGPGGPDPRSRRDAGLPRRHHLLGPARDRGHRAPAPEPADSREGTRDRDVLSGGRLIVGIGVGYIEREFAAIGVPFADRGARLEEHLAAMRAIWTERRPALTGRFVAFDHVQAHPRPLQLPHPPIVMGGHAPTVLRRTVLQADGWYGWGLDPGSTARSIAALGEIEAQSGRGEGLGTLEITVTPPGSVEPAEAAIYEELGVDGLNLMLPWTADDRGIASFFEGVIQPLVDAQRRHGAAR